MKIAILSTKPASLESGTEARNYHILSGLQKKYAVNYYSPKLPNALPTDRPWQRINYVLSGMIPYIEYLKRGIFPEDTLNEIRNADIIQLQEIESYFVFEKYIPTINKPIILDAHNVEYYRFLSEIENKGFVEKNVGRLLSSRLKQLEIDALKNITHLLVCSKNDFSYFGQYLPQNKVTILPNGVDVNSYKVTRGIQSNSILFMGLLSYPPNANGLKKYIEKVHPRVLKNTPDVELVILGKGKPDWLENYARSDKSIKIVGFVDDVRDYIKQAGVCICPVFSGSGTRVKILEYMAMGKPVVSTVKGAEGLDVVNEKHLLLADNPEEFAISIENILTSKKLAHSIAMNGRKLVEEKYDWNKNIKKLYELCSLINIR